jgi:hypothetical protein
MSKQMQGLYALEAEMIMEDPCVICTSIYVFPMPNLQTRSWNISVGIVTWRWDTWPGFNWQQLEVFCSLLLLLSSSSSSCVCVCVCVCVHARMCYHGHAWVETNNHSYNTFQGSSYRVEVAVLFSQTACPLFCKKGLTHDLNWVVCSKSFN